MENIKPPNISELKVSLSKYSHFLIELKKRLLAVLGVFVVATIGGFVFYEKIIKTLIDFLSLRGVNLVFTSPFQYLNLAVTCGVATGLIAVFPFIIFQLLSFLRPALKRKEFKAILGLLPFSLVLFLIGFVFGAVIMKWQIQIFLDKSVALGIGNILDISRLLSTILLTSTLMGVGFQFPIILLLLMRLGIVKRSQLAKLRGWIYLASLIFAILLPADSILADLLLALPLIILFEVTLLLDKILTSKKTDAT